MFCLLRSAQLLFPPKKFQINPLILNLNLAPVSSYNLFCARITVFTFCTFTIRSFVASIKDRTFAFTSTSNLQCRPCLPTTSLSAPTPPLQHTASSISISPARTPYPPNTTAPSSATSKPPTAAPSVSATSSPMLSTSSWSIT